MEINFTLEELAIIKKVFENYFAVLEIMGIVPIFELQGLDITRKIQKVLNAGFIK